MANYNWKLAQNRNSDSELSDLESTQLDRMDGVELGDGGKVHSDDEMYDGISEVGSDSKAIKSLARVTRSRRNYGKKSIKQSYSCSIWNQVIMKLLDGILVKTKLLGGRTVICRKKNSY